MLTNLYSLGESMKLSRVLMGTYSWAAGTFGSTVRVPCELLLRIESKSSVGRGQVKANKAERKIKRVSPILSVQRGSVRFGVIEEC